MLFSQNSSTSKSASTNLNLFGNTSNGLFVFPSSTIITKPVVENSPVGRMDSAKTDYRSADRKLYSEMPFSDVKFEVEEKQFSAHKCILFTRCPEFSSQYIKDDQEKDALIKISEMDSATFQALLQFIYCGDELILTDENIAISLLKQAQKYSLPALRGLCEKFLIGKMSVSNIIKITNISEQEKAEKLTESALTFIYNHFDAIFEQGGNQPSDLSNTLLLKLFKKNKQ